MERKFVSLGPLLVIAAVVWMAVTNAVGFPSSAVKGVGMPILMIGVLSPLIAKIIRDYRK